MRDLGIDNFDDFFCELWGKPPFAWQKSLTSRILDNPNAPWPEAIGLPTGAGKTACIDIAVFTLAASVSRLGPGRPLPAPRRVFFTVDRRIIVDEAYRRANAIAARLKEARDGCLRDVADCLRLLDENRNDVSPLGAHLLRGGMYRAEGWARSPARPAIICTTVDQLGSRLLFRGYGRSSRAWPIHAGLAGNDSLILLDEAHCARPLLQTLGAIQRYRTWVDECLDNPFYVSIMSATPPEGVRDVFRDTSREPDDPAHPLGRRQRAAKKANLREPVKGKGKAADEKMAKLLAKLAIEHADEVNRAIVVFCNRVATARSVHARVLASKQFRGRTTLLTGRMRPLDKDDVVQRDLAKLDSGSSHERVLEEPVIVVATQTLEVGADLDFDALVTECASLDALRQRFGRLNRAGRELTARASIVVREEQIGDTSDDPVYGAALGGTWRWLQKVAEDGEVDFGIAALDNRLPSADKLVELTVEPSLTPVMLPAHVDRWAQTWPQPRASADVSLFLHGAQRASADVQVCWRADIDLADEGTEKAALDTLSLVPPAPAECLPVPIGVLRRWLRHDDELDNSSDLEGETVPASENPAKSFSDRKIIRWRNRDDVKIAKDSRGLRPGDVCVLPATMDESFVLSDFPLGACLDIGDRANLENRGRAVLRVHDELLKKWPQTPVVVAFRDWVKRSAALYDEDPDTTRAALLDYLGAIAEELDGDSECRWMKQICGALVKDKHVKLAVHAAGGFVLRGSRRGKASREASDFGDEDDATASGTVYVPLSAHLDGVGDFAERFAKSCGLPDRLVKALRRAGELHDLGKADPRFQAMLRNGNLWARGPLLAKSSDIPRSRYRYIAAREAAGYPKGGRHELLSVRLAESADKLLPSDNLLRDLVLHLVASHHGYCRPFAPVVVDENPRDVAVDFKDCRMSYSSETHLERLDSGVSARYWRLTRHFGWWGLAWLEAILRLADHRRSEWEEMHKGQVQ